MKIKFPLTIIIAFTLMGCVANRSKLPNDWALQSPRTSAILSIVDDDGKAVLPFNGNYFSVPGYIFVANEILLHPGTKRISYQCPQPEDAIRINDYVPSVSFTFEIGRKYELHCSNGQPVISLAKEQDE